MDHAHTQGPDEREVLVDLVDFKWLMAGAGWWVDLSRLRRDSGYARECLRHAAASGSPLLCRRSAELLGGLAGRRP